MRSLEDALSVVLFVRDVRRTALTDAGAALLRDARDDRADAAHRAPVLAIPEGHRWPGEELIEPGWLDGQPLIVLARDLAPSAYDAAESALRARDIVPRTLDARSEMDRRAWWWVAGCGVGGVDCVGHVARFGGDIGARGCPTGRVGGLREPSGWSA